MLFVQFGFWVMFFALALVWFALPFGPLAALEIKAEPLFAICERPGSIGQKTS